MRPFILFTLIYVQAAMAGHVSFYEGFQQGSEEQCAHVVSDVAAKIERSRLGGAQVLEAFCRDRQPFISFATAVSENGVQNAMLKSKLLGSGANGILADEDLGRFMTEIESHFASPTFYVLEVGYLTNSLTMPSVSILRTAPVAEWPHVYIGQNYLIEECEAKLAEILLDLRGKFQKAAGVCFGLQNEYGVAKPVAFFLY